MRALAEGAVLLAMRDLSAGKGAAALPLETSISLGGTPIRIRMASAAGWLDINTAPPERLERLLAHIGGLDRREAQVLAARIVDWRDPDTVATPGGAEDEAYESAGSVYRTRGERFATPEDLLQVLGVSFEVFDRIRGFVTTEGSGDGVLDARSAPQALLEAMGESALPAGSFNAAGVPPEFLGAGNALRVEARISAGGRREYVHVAWIRINAASEGSLPIEVLRTEPPTFWTSTD